MWLTHLQVKKLQACNAYLSHAAQSTICALHNIVNLILMAIGYIIFFWSCHAALTAVVHTQHQHVSSLPEAVTCSNMWFIPRTGTCHCGSIVRDVVTCDEYTKEIMVLACYCMTADSVTNQTVVGACLYNCVNSSTMKQYKDNTYRKAPSNCIGLKRKGTLCGECDTDNNTFPPTYSYNMNCVQCIYPDSLWLYIAVAFLPLTLFIAIILACRISVISPQLRAFVFFAQMISTPTNVRPLMLSALHASPAVSSVIRIYAAAYGIWNLDFFRTLLPSVCLHLSTLQVLALDYLIAVYPMLLMVIAYILVELHGYGFRPLLIMWRPFHYVFARFRREWDIQTSIVDVFITFFILSTTKMFSVSFDLLIPTRLYNASGQSVGLRLFYDPNIVYMGQHHLKYALLALILFTLFVICPLFLLLLSSFNCCSNFRSRIITEFLFSFHRYYKDGRNGTTNRQWYACFYILVFFFTYITYASTLSNFTYFFCIIVFTSIAVALILVEPYKKEYSIHNRGDSILFLWLALSCASLAGFNCSKQSQIIYLSLFQFVTAFTWTVPLIYVTLLVIQWIWKRTCQRECQRVAIHEESLPYRICHSTEYNTAVNTQRNHPCYLK